MIFSKGEYTKLFKKMQEFYSINSASCRKLAVFERDSVCVGLFDTKYYRVQMKKIQDNKLVCHM